MAFDFAAVIAILKIILYDLALSGDNAAVIGLAAHRLPAKQRRQAMIWGCGLAIIMRIAFTLVVYKLLDVPGLRFVGAILLVVIACKLMQEEVHAASNPDAAPASLFKAVQRIAAADFIMSLDNVLAIASAARTWSEIIIGLILSIIMLLFLSALITEVMRRWRFIAYLAVALLAAAAGEMMAHDVHDFFHYLQSHYSPGWPEFPRWAKWALEAGLVVLCLTVNWWWPAAPHVPEGTAAEPGLEADPVEHPAEA
ncbi:YjbE family putative metal transport protein [Paludisphaera rhizosphaerae]|uniref:YjbE family putative metal transport protein n=1 Tax=Paludisphaera rhizosphaerae TaxID=2711216 RepID=UPI0013EADD8E|nr:YjbE family putative metal transport protein [Paludisphaera rhizosphaerae]